MINSTKDLKALIQRRTWKG